jgi:hypothetical protein
MGSRKHEEHEDDRRSGFPQAHEDRTTSLQDPFIKNGGPRRPCCLSSSERKNCYDAAGQFFTGNTIISLNYSYLGRKTQTAEIRRPFEFCNRRLDFPESASICSNNGPS